MGSIQPNRYVMQTHDGSTKVDYETSSFAGLPILSLTRTPGHPIMHFSGSQIRVVATDVGMLVTVRTAMTIDAGSTSLSFLIPAISLTAISDRSAFETEAIITSHSGPRSVPSGGVHETYQFIPLNGEASLVISVIRSVVGSLGEHEGK